MKLKWVISLIFTLSVIAHVHADQGDADISLYTGTFDVIDKEGDDKTTLFGIEHKNPNLFRDTFLGKFKPVTGAFMTGNSSLYLYTGVEAQYGIGPLIICLMPTLFKTGVISPANSASGKNRSKFSGKSCLTKSPGIVGEPNGKVSSSYPPTTKRAPTSGL